MDQHILRWGLLSTADINSALIPPLRTSKRNHLSAVASRSQVKADEYARKWRIPRTFGSYEALLADPEIDVIYNPLPNHLHAEWSIKAMQAGKHVLCEKPLALSVKDVDEMAKSSKKHGRILTEAFMYRHHQQTLKIKEMIENGDLGQLQLIKGVFTFPIASEKNIRLDPKMGGGSIWDVGCYPINFARTMVGKEPIEVFGWQVKGRNGVDETFVGQLRFPDGIYAQFDSGFRSPDRAFIEIVGSQASLRVPVSFKPDTKSIIELVRGNQVKRINIRSQPLYLGEIEDIADAILLGKPPRISLADSRANVAAIRALLKSAESGKPIKLK